MMILRLEDNLLSGELADCWMNWQKLSTLNLGNNKFIRNLPSSIGSIRWLQSLHLRKNHLSGILPTSLKNCTSLTTFDVAENWFVGNIPIWIGQEVLGKNSLSGRIPETIGVMTSLESLDFSANQLTGEIPLVISGLTFLSHLNLSNNNLTEKIPTSTQLQSFDASSFVGNDLCGSPLPKNCTSAILTPANDHSGGKNGNEHEVDWFYVGMALGCVVGFWSIIGPLLVNRRWRYLYLFRAGYGGNVPHNIGNILSNLQYLDLGNNSNIRAENLGWLSGLSLLKYLDLSFMDIKKSLIGCG
ncbi:receptor-like protein EIX2 [Pistacia vera]|uniref:receptor-like protein EIX2 n=1 Tax=Pistacia vera TaxID=55513 RepID=UPI001263D7B1|nr:receptor-like protein EIX2 [Pistacia vera]